MPDKSDTDIQEILVDFVNELKPVEHVSVADLFTDNRTGARYCECHIRAIELVAHATTDTNGPLM